MKRFAIVLGALCAFVMLSIYCTNVDYNNPIDPMNVDSYLDELKLCDGITFPYTVKDLNNNNKVLNDCPELRAYAIVEDEEGIANIRNDRHPLKQMFDEDKSPTRVTLLRDVVVEISDKSIARYNELTHESNWDSIGVKLEPVPVNGHPNYTRKVRVTSDEAGNNEITRPVTVIPTGTYYIWYIASRTLKGSGDILADSISRKLIVKQDDDNDPPKISLRESSQTTMTLIEGQKFSDPGAIASTKYESSIPYERTFSPSFNSLIGMGFLKIAENGDTLAALESNLLTTTFTITYTARHPVNLQTASVQRTVVINKAPVNVLPRPVFVFSRYAISAQGQTINSIDTVLVASNHATFREPGIGSVRAYYLDVLNRDTVWIASNLIKPRANNPTSFTIYGQRFINYDIDSVAGVYQAANARRTVFVTDSECELPLAPTSTITGANPVTISRGTAWNLASGWSLTANDELEVGGTKPSPYRVADLDGLNLADPQPKAGGGQYNLKLLGIGGCGVAAQVLSWGVIVQ